MVPAIHEFQEFRAGRPIKQAFFDTKDSSVRIVLFEDGAGLMVDDLLMIHAGCAAGKVTVEPAAPFAMERRRLPL